MMDLDVLITGGVGVVTTFASGFVSYLFTKRKYDAEVDSEKIANMQKALEFYNTNYESNKKILEDVQKENEELREDNKKLQKQLDEYEDKVHALEHTNNDLMERVTKLESLITTVSSKKTPKKSKK